MKVSNRLGSGIFPLVIFSMFFVSGCLATQDWVQTYVPEQLFPVNKRISDTEANVTQLGGRVSTVEGQVQQMSNQIADLDNRLRQTTTKADQALENIQRLKLERKMVLDFKQGAFFASNSTVLTAGAKQDIDGFLSDLRGDSGDASSLLFVVAGHTDNVGSPKYNYQLARIRAESAASYLTNEKKIDAGRLVVLSYGESAPVADNNSAEGRAKNRRIEILVYKDNIGVGSAGRAESLPNSKTR
jgi:outer membrane protein OmpA-like peptidoglycan-associated protein